MSDIPPQEPPQQYAAYPRGGPVAGQYGSADQLQALSDGYFGLNTVFVLNLVLAFASRAGTATAKDPATALAILGGFVLVTGLVVGFCTYPYNKKIAYGANWNPGMAVLASVLMALNSALCCGIVGYVVVQTLALKEIKKYGLQGGFFGVKKADIAAKIAQMRSMPSAPTNFQP